MRTESNKKYFLYCKHATMKKAWPLGADIDGNVGPVNKKLCAFLFDAEKAQKALEHYKKENPDWHWELRAVKL